MKTIFLTTLLLISCSLSAQYDDILKDANIIWAATLEYDIDLNTGEVGINSNKEQKVFSEDLKSISEKEKDNIFNDFKQNKNLISHALTENEYKNLAFFDANNKNQITGEAIKKLFSSIDTIITFDPNTYQEEMKIQRSKLEHYHIVKYRVQELLTWNETTNSLERKIVAIAPYLLMNRFSKKQRISFWIHPESLPTAAQSIWSKIPDVIKRTRIYFTLDELRNIKNNGKELSELYIEGLKNKKIKGYYGYPDELIKDEHLEKMIKGSGMDTIITYDPETFEETITIVKNVWDLNDQENINFKLDGLLFFDEKTFNMSIKSKMVSLCYTKDNKHSYSEQRIRIVTEEKKE